MTPPLTAGWVFNLEVSLAHSNALSACPIAGYDLGRLGRWAWTGLDLGHRDQFRFDFVRHRIKVDAYPLFRVEMKVLRRWQPQAGGVGLCCVVFLLCRDGVAQVPPDG